MAVSFSCDICHAPCGVRDSVMIQRSASLPAEGRRWLKGISIIMWDQEAAGSGRYDHAHIVKCLAQWIARNKLVFTTETQRHDE